MSNTLPARLGKYEIRGALGRGAMGTVYDGWDPVIERRVAIKTVGLAGADDDEATDALARFKREAQAAGRLVHPNIVGVFDYGETDELAFIVMEFVEGHSLKEELGAGGRVAPAEAVRLMQDVLAGLAYSHGRGVVHRDIKPANIMLTKENQAKIADFGIARIESSSMTQAGTVMGTPAYMSPEQFMGQVVDRRTDLYSCGVMLFQLLTGERPFEGSLASIMHKATTTTPPRPSDISVTSPPALDAVVAKAMARRPDDRYDTAAEFAQALRTPPAPVAAPDDATMIAPRAAAPSPAAPAAAAKAPTPTPKSRTPLLAAAGAGVLAAAAAATWLLLPGTPPPVPHTETGQHDAGDTGTPTGTRTRPPLINTPSGQTPGDAPPIVQSPINTSPISTPPGSTPGTTAPVATGTASLPPDPSGPPTVVTPSGPSSEPPAQQTASAGTAPSQAPISPPTSQPSATDPRPIPVLAMPPPTPAAVAAALSTRLPNVSCTLLRPTIVGGTVHVTGLVGTAAAADAVRVAVDAAGPATLDARRFDGPYCSVLDLLRGLPDAAPGLVLQQDGGPLPLRDNQVIALHATMPGFAGYLHVAYVQHDEHGQNPPTVSQQVPGPGYPAQTYAARAVLSLGNPGPGFIGWKVGPPFGTDMIVAVASTAPLFSRPPPDDQPLPAYLASLRDAIESLRRRGGTVSATATTVDTRPGP